MSAAKIATLNRVQIIALAKKAEKLPEPKRSKLKALIRGRAMALGMKPDGDGDYDGDVPSKIPGGMGYKRPA